MLDHIRNSDETVLKGCDKPRFCYHIMYLAHFLLCVFWCLVLLCRFYLFTRRIFSHPSHFPSCLMWQVCSVWFCDAVVIECGVSAAGCEWLCASNPLVWDVWRVLSSYLLFNHRNAVWHPRAGKIYYWNSCLAAKVKHAAARFTDSETKWRDWLQQ